MFKRLIRRCYMCRAIELEVDGENVLVQQRDYCGDKFKFSDGLLSKECAERHYSILGLSRIDINSINGLYETCGDYD